MLPFTETHPFCKFIAVQSDMAELDPPCRDGLRSHRTGRSPITFEQFRYREVAEIQTLSIAYTSFEANRLIFANKPGLQIHLRRKGTGIYSYDEAGFVEGKTCEMQIFCTSRPWQKQVVERPRADAQSVLFHLPLKKATDFLGDLAVNLHERADRQFQHLRLAIPDELTRALDELFRLPDGELPELRRSARLLDLLVGSMEGFRDAVEQACEDHSLHPADRMRIAMIQRRIHADLANCPSLDGLAAEAGMSPSKFKVKFRQVTGKPVGAYVRSARMAEAARLLVDGHTVSEVAFSLGYRHGGHFARIFRGTFGVTPVQFRTGRTLLRREAVGIH